MDSDNRSVTPCEDRDNIRKEIGARGDERLARAVAVLEESGTGHRGDEVPPMPESLLDRIREQYGTVAVADHRPPGRVRSAPAPTGGWLEKVRATLTSPPWVLGGLATACFALGIWTFTGIGDGDGSGVARGGGADAGPGAVVFLVGAAEDVPGLDPAMAIRVALPGDLERELAAHRDSIRIVVGEDGVVTGFRSGADRPAASVAAGEHPDGVYDALIDLEERLR